ncbi:MAG: DUF1062 domain-containing protein [Tabrizicola sp.]
MTRILHVTWHVVPLSLPLAQRHCSTCGGPRLFHCSGKVRLNANGRRLDAWLIYKCQACDRTWNLPILDRTPVAEVPPAELSAMQASDPAWVRSRAFDLAALRRHVPQVILPTDLAVTKQVPGTGSGDWSRIVLAIEAPWPIGLRLDRLLAHELDLSRSSLQAMMGTGALGIERGSRTALKTALAGSVVLRFDFDGIAASTRTDLARAFGPPPPGEGL